MISKDTLLECELLLWGIDALEKWQYVLESSIDRIYEARKDLMAQIADVSSQIGFATSLPELEFRCLFIKLNFVQGPGNRHSMLEKMCQEYLRDFEISFEQLIAVNSKLKRTIDLKKHHQETVRSRIIHTLAGLLTQGLQFFSMQEMDDSQNLQSQNLASLRLQIGVSRLTYLTIVYLPPALIAVS
jgi:hypothetical protein